MTHVTQVSHDPCDPSTEQLTRDPRDLRPTPYSQRYLFNAIPYTNHNANPTNPNRYSKGNPDPTNPTNLNTRCRCE